MIVESSNPAHSVADSAACRDGIRVPGTDGGHRCRDDGDGAAGPLCAARGKPVREAGGDVLQSGVPAQHISSPTSAPRAAAGHVARAGDLGAPGARARCRRRRRPEATARGRRPRLGRIRTGFSRSRQRQPRDVAGAAVRSLRDARAHAARATQGRSGAVGAGAEDGDDLSRSGAARRSRRRQRALRGDPAKPLGCDVHRARVRGRLRADRPRRSQDRARDARNAR